MPGQLHDTLPIDTKEMDSFFCPTLCFKISQATNQHNVYKLSFDTKTIMILCAVYINTYVSFYNSILLYFIFWYYMILPWYYYDTHLILIYIICIFKTCKCYKSLWFIAIAPPAVGAAPPRAAPRAHPTCETKQRERQETRNNGFWTTGFKT